MSYGLYQCPWLETSLDWALGSLGLGRCGWRERGNSAPAPGAVVGIAAVVYPFFLGQGLDRGQQGEIESQFGQGAAPLPVSHEPA